MLDEIKFQVREYQGTEVFKYLAEDHPDHLHREKLQPITQKEGLVPGDVVLIPALIGGGFFLMTVQADEDGLLAEADEILASSDQMMALLKFGEDERKAWVCTGLINKRGLEKLRSSL
jgi:hypothetical protein